MVKFNNSSQKQLFEPEDISPEMLGIDWQQLLVDFQNKPVDETIKCIMEKFLVKENVELDQICLILKHYILLNLENSQQKLPYLNHFLAFNDQIYVNQLIERFINLGQNPNSQWMITEIIKLISSICNEEQAGYLLKSSNFSKFLLNSIFDSAILVKLKSTSGGFSTIESAILTNLFETISNLCGIKSELKNFVSQTHIDWLADALSGINRAHTELAESIAHIFHLISDNENLNHTLGDLFVNKNFFNNCMQYLSLNIETNQIETSFNLNAKLYLMASMTNIINLNKNQVESKTIDFLNLLKDYSFLIQYSLDLNLNQNLNQETENLFNNKCSDSDNETKHIIKSLEKSSESKILSLDILTSILNHFIKENSDEEEYESWDECSEDGMDENNNMDKVEMDVEMDKSENKIDAKYIYELKNIVNNIKLMDLLVKTISRDDENILQETDRIEHIYNSVKLIRSEALKTYLLLIDAFYLNKRIDNIDSSIDIRNLFVLLELLAKKSVEDLQTEETDNKDESIVKFVEIIYDLFSFFNESKQNVLTRENNVTIVNLIKDILLKFRFDVIELCVRLARILGIIAIKERNANVIEGKEIILTCATILMELTVGSFEMTDQNKIETLRLNAELMDVIIDLFGEDNLADIENEVGFIERIKYFSDKFYAQWWKWICHRRQLTSGKIYFADVCDKSISTTVCMLLKMTV